MRLGVRKNPDIEALRTVGVLFVLVGHSAQMFNSHPGLEALLGLFNGSFAVDLFFALSGYMITRGLLPSLQNAWQDKQHWRVVRAFWVRRIFRLWPLAWFWLIAILMLSVFWNESGYFSSPETNLAASIAGAFQLANVRFALAWDEGFNYGASFVYWSLSLEEQFYFVLPLILIFFRRHYIWILIFIFLVQVWQVRGIWLIAFRTDAMALGCLLAVAHIKQVAWLEWVRRLVVSIPRMFLWVVLLALMLVMAYLSTWSKFNYFVGVIAVLTNVLVIVASFESNLLSPNALIEKIFIWVGERTYAIYLLHIPVYFIVRESWAQLGGGEYTAAVVVVHYALAAVLVIVFADASFRLIEKPFRRMGNNLSARMLKAAAVPVANSDASKVDVSKV